MLHQIQAEERLGAPYLLGENRFSELFDKVLETQLRERLKKETDDAIAERISEDTAKN